MIPGETVATGAPVVCPDCGEHVLGPREMQSTAGYYIGYVCDGCGPYSRESGYYPTFKAASEALKTGEYGRV